MADTAMRAHVLTGKPAGTLPYPNRPLTGTL